MMLTLSLEDILDNLGYLNAYAYLEERSAAEAEGRPSPPVPDSQTRDKPEPKPRVKAQPKPPTEPGNGFSGPLGISWG